MNLIDAPIDVQSAAFVEMVLSNRIIAIVLERMGQLSLNGAYLAAGALFQTAWNCLDWRDPGAGILDYDINYFDAEDVSWDAEDRVIKRAEQLYGDLPVRVEVRNEARVHLWYRQKFGVDCPPYTSTESAIRTFPNTSSCFGIRMDDAVPVVYAPFGFTDLFAMRTRPNPVLAPRHVYETKTARWLTQWPGLEVLPWPAAHEVC